MTVRGAGLTVLLLASAITWATSSLAAPLPAHNLFKELFFAGCIPSVVTGTTVESYARQAQMSYARPELASAFLDGRSGNVYIRPDPQTPMVIVQFSDGACSVAARTSPDLPGLIAVVEQMLIGSGSPFKRIKSTRGNESSGEATTSLEYEGSINGRSFGVLLSTNPSQGVRVQAIATVFKR